VNVGDVADPTEGVASFLLAQMGAAANGRVFRPELPEVRDFEMPTSAVVVMPAGEGKLMAGTRQGALDSMMDVICYGETRLNADNLARQAKTLLDLLKMVTVPCLDDEGKILLWWSRTASGLQPRVEGQAEWPFTEFTIQCLHSRYVI
jgi:hypothetical protein